jgi:hypothetical protein
MKIAGTKYVTFINKSKEIILHFFTVLFFIPENSRIMSDLLSLQTEEIKYKISKNESINLSLKTQDRFLYEK